MNNDVNYKAIPVNIDGDIGFAVQPKEDCPHCDIEGLQKMYSQSSILFQIQICRAGGGKIFLFALSGLRPQTRELDMCNLQGGSLFSLCKLYAFK